MRAFAEVWPDAGFVQGVASVSFQTGIKKPACGRLLGDGFGLFLVSLARLQNVHPE